MNVQYQIDLILIENKQLQGTLDWQEQQASTTRQLVHSNKKNTAMMDLLHQQNEFMNDLEQRIQKVLKWGTKLKHDLERVRGDRNKAKAYNKELYKQIEDVKDANRLLDAENVQLRTKVETIASAHTTLEQKLQLAIQSNKSESNQAEIATKLHATHLDKLKIEQECNHLSDTVRKLHHQLTEYQNVKHYASDLQKQGMSP